MNEAQEITYDYDQPLSQIELLLKGQVDFVEVGDCRIPGRPQNIRAIATQDPHFPLAFYGADKVPRPGSTEKMTIDQGLAKARAHQASLASELGSHAKVFTVKLRKMWTDG